MGPNARVGPTNGLLQLPRWVMAVPWAGATACGAGAALAAAFELPAPFYALFLAVTAGVAAAGLAGRLPPPWWFAVPFLCGLTALAPLALLLSPWRPDLWRRLREGVKGKWRRYVLISRHSEYVQAWAERRLGECKRCGACCKFIFRCPHYEELPDGRGNCRVFAAGSRLRPEQCARFPIDPIDLESVASVCSYSFPAAPAKAAARPNAPPLTIAFINDRGPRRLAELPADE